MNTVPSMSAPVAGDPVELQVSSDMVKRGLMAAPLPDRRSAFRDLGQPTAPGRRRYAIGLVLVNFMLSALLIGWAATNLVGGR